MLMGSGGVLHSYDGGETWIDPGGDRSAYGPFPVVALVYLVALDESNLYRAYHAGIARSTDGGVTWHPFMTGMVNSHVPSLVTVNNVLYALTPKETLKSADGGETWKSVGLNTNENASLEAVTSESRNDQRCALCKQQ